MNKFNSDNIRLGPNSYDVPMFAGSPGTARFSLRNHFDNKWLHVGFYAYGALIEYKGVIEHWAVEHSFHNHNQGGPTPYGPPAILWVGNNTDTGGIYLSGVQECHMDGPQVVVEKEYVEIVSQHFDKTPHGDIRNIVRGPQDKHEFRGGPPGNETVYGSIGPDGLKIGDCDVLAKLAELEARLSVLELSEV